jgi:long-chain acyl-CoA synthetase
MEWVYMEGHAEEGRYEPGAAAVPGFWGFAAAHPGRVAAVDCDGHPKTYGEAGAQVNRISRALRRLGLRGGDRIAVIIPNRFAHLEVVLAAAQIGVDQVPVNVHLTASEIAYILADAAPAAVVVDRQTAGIARYACQRALSGDVPVLDVDGSLGELAARESGAALDDRSGASAIPYTSGTSGQPKGVLRAHGLGSPEDIAVTPLTYLLRRFGIDLAAEVGTGVHLVTSPLYHGAPGGYAKLALHLGHTLVISPRFDAARALHLIERHQVTWMNVVPTMFKRLLDLPEDVRAAADLSSLRWVFHGGAPCPPELKRRMLSWLGPIIYEYYAATEGGGTFIGPDEWLTRPASVGRPWPGAEIRILDETGADLPPGEVGQVYFRTQRPFEYHNDPEKTKGSRTPDGRYVTAGDLGYLDGDGYLYLAARRSDLIISGGVNIYPAEIEAVLLESPLVADAAVIGVDDRDWGQAVVAVVQPTSATPDQVMADELASLCRERLAPFKCPKRFVFTDDIGRTPSGKIRREVLYERYLAVTSG